MPANHNAPPSHEQQVAVPELVQFIDPESPGLGEFASLFNTPGEDIVIGQNSDFKHGQDFGPDGGDLVIIRTKSGNAYGIGAGVMINNRKRTASRLPEVLQPIPLGRPWEVEGAGTTAEVDSVLLRHGGKRGALGDDGARVINSPSPFTDLLKEIEVARARLYPGEHFPSLS